MPSVTDDAPVTCSACGEPASFTTARLWTREGGWRLATYRQCNGRAGKPTATGWRATCRVTELVDQVPLEEDVPPPVLPVRWEIPKAKVKEKVEMGKDNGKDDQIREMVLADKSYSQIQNVLKVRPETVSRVRKEVALEKQAAAIARAEIEKADHPSMPPPLYLGAALDAVADGDDSDDSSDQAPRHPVREATSILRGMTLGQYHALPVEVREAVDVLVRR